MVRRTGVNPCSFVSFVAAIVLLIAFPSGLAFAQTATATIVGTVKDTSGALIPGVSITVKHTDTGQTRMAISSDSGSYNVPLLPVGAYELTTTMPGFKMEVRSGINLVIGQQAVIDLTLEVGAAAEQITVSEEAPLVNTTLSSTSGLITEQQVKDLPLNGRSFDQLLVLNAGVVNNASNMGGGGGFPAYSVAGHRQETNRFMINGVDWIGGNATHQFITPSGASSQLLGVEAVREYNVLEHTYGAEYGKRAGGQVSIVTSSGTNNWHGDLFEYHRNSALDAKDFFTTDKNPFKRNQFGGTIGGPLKKDKLFVFGNYEGFRQRLGQSSRGIYPDVPARQGLLPCYLAYPTNTAANCANPAALVTVPNLKPGMLPYANTFWPVPNGPEIPSATGLPTGTAYNYNSAVQKASENFVMTRVDYVISPKDTIFGNYTISDGERDTPQADMFYTQFVPVRSQTYGMTETHVFSPTVVNSATLGWVRPYGGQVTTVNGLGPAIPQSLIFLQGGGPGSITIGASATTVGPQSVTPAPGNNPLAGINEFYSVADDLRFTKGKHSFSTGVWIQRVHENSVGAAQFSAGGASYPTLARFLQDDPANPFNLNRNPVMIGYRMTQYAWYFQDEMKLRSNLTVRLGLRHEMTNGWNEVAGRCANYTFDKNQVISTEPRIGTSCLTENHAKLLLQPRVGLAWDPTGTGSWAVRAGFGIHNDLQDNLANRTYSNAPYNAREQITGPTLSLIPFRKSDPLPLTCGVPGAPVFPSAGCGLYSPGGVDPVLFTPTSQQWSLTIERGLARDLVLSVGYVGSQSYHTPLSVNANAIYPLICDSPQGCISGGTLTNGNPVPANAQVRVPQGTLYHPPSYRPNPNVGSGTQWIDQGTSSYNGMDVSLTKRASRGLTFKANYTYSKIMDLNSAILAPSAGNEPSNIPSPYYRRELNRGIGSYSLLHQFNAYYSYQLPFGNGQHFGSGATGVVDKLIGGWQWNGGLRWAGGFPFTPIAGSNISGTGDASNSDVPSWNPNFKGPVILGKPDQWFDPRAFVLPLQGTFGNVARGSLRGPHLFNLDTSFLKKVRISEGLNLQFRTEVFNVLNHPNFAYPNEVIFNGTQYSPSAGVISTTATPSRQIQFALKLIF